ncbi:hypothetical protein PCAR4_290193 [Paraburkholderia caribensis]|nr:hypothetical protein PCAR4_290193 [Paraburkholderia caribensis]
MNFRVRTFWTVRSKNPNMLPGFTATGEMCKSGGASWSKSASVFPGLFALQVPDRAMIRRRERARLP